jgi:hypothetical protein
MSKSYFSRFGEWQNYAHYALLSFIITIYYYNTQSLVDFNFVTQIGLYIKIFFEMAIVLLVADSLVHGLFYYFPIRKYRWRD